MAFEDLLYPLLSHYLGAPDWLKAPAGHAYALLPGVLRLGRHYYRFRDELVQTTDPAAAADLARRKLGETLEWTIRTVPAYQEYLPLLARRREPEELLAALPTVSKSEIKASPERYLSKEIPASQRLKTVTGGTSRIPMEFYLHKHVTRAKEYAFIEAFRRRAGFTGRELTLSLRGRPVHGAACASGKLRTYEPIKRQLILSSMHFDGTHMPRFAEILTRYRPQTIEAFPSVLYPLARWLGENPQPAFTSGVKSVLLYSENVYDFQMRLFREVFGCPVLKHYGHSERVLMAASLPNDDRYYFWPQYGWLELVDFDGKPVREPGVPGEIVGTSFDNRVMPFVRYRTGDIAVLSAQGSAVLPGFIALERIEGRMQEYLIDRDHRPLSMVNIGAAHFPWFGRMQAMQYEQSKPGELILKFVAGEDFTADMQGRLAAAVSEKTRCEVRIVKVESIARTERGKQQMLVQHLDAGRYFRSAMIA
jgi:phenylacetate-CoA ligase